MNDFIDHLFLPAVTGLDVLTLARTSWGEARGEGVAGMEAVAAVVRNRVHLDLNDDGRPDWWGEGYANVCLRPWQFSCWNDNDPNRDKLLGLAYTSPELIEALDVARRCVHWAYPDPTSGSTHYVATSLLATLRGNHWARVAVPRRVIGRHTFFKLD